MYDPKETNDITPFNEIKPIIESNRNKNRHHHHHHDHQQQQQQQQNNNNYSFSLQKKNLNPPLIENIPQKVLSYSIHDYSSYSAAYHPKHILENKPLDQASRWSSAIHDQNQFITITFPSPVVAKSITLGKFHRAHACNLKEFKIYGGYSKDNMLELLNSGLRNDNEPENFDLRIHRQQMIFPIQYLKIVPIATFGANFNYSIWFMEVYGIDDSSVIDNLVTQYQNYQEVQTTRLCLKHFRQRNMMNVFNMIKEGTGIEIEHPLITALHTELVIKGDFEKTEHILEQLYQQRIFEDYSKNSSYKANWRRLWATNLDGDSPSPRGGHQMCLDQEGRRIYLLGGWDGYQDLSDFWCYDIQKEQWKLLSNDTLKNGGPSPRSCHKIGFDSKSRSIFVLGKYVECHSVPESHLEPDFYRYYCDEDKWEKISHNTVQEGGPGLIFDHQMCIDTENEMIYIFGGRCVSYDISRHVYSGLYAYHIPSNTWKLLSIDNGGNGPKPYDIFSDSSSSLSSCGGNRSRLKSMKSRVGHSMLLDPSSKQLYIFAGQRSKDYMSDFFTYSLDNQQVKEISQDYSKENGPEVGYTQRATMDSGLKEIYVLSGYLKNQGSDIIKNGLWVYSIDQNQWKNVYQNENRDPDYWKAMKHIEPCPRFAHQMIYDPLSKLHFIFGGNPGDHECSSTRLNDFWQLKLTRPNPDDILRRSIYMVRLQQLREKSISISSTNSTKDDTNYDHKLNALDYLRTYLTPLVNHDNQEELVEFRKLCTELCLSSENNFLSSSNENNHQDSFNQRKQVFDALLEYIPPEMKEPVEQLLDVIKLT